MRSKRRGWGWRLGLTEANGDAYIWRTLSMQCSISVKGGAKGGPRSERKKRKRMIGYRSRSRYGRSSKGQNSLQDMRKSAFFSVLLYSRVGKEQGFILYSQQDTHSISSSNTYSIAILFMLQPVVRAVFQPVPGFLLAL